MKLKNIVIGLISFIFIGVSSACLATETSDSAIRNMINLYKNGNYLGCIDSSNKIIENNPADIFAYYYKALSYTQLGKTMEASEAYTQVITLNTNSTLVEYSKRANACISNPMDCEKYQKQINDLDDFIKSKKTYSDAVQSQINQKKLDRIRENINDEVNNENKKSEMPSNDEIANAVKTLAKIGLNPMASMNSMYTNPQMMQMSMLLGDNTNNNQMNMLPMLLMNQNGTQQMSPDLIQTMMMTQMSPAL